MRIYDSMLFKSLVVKRDPRTGNALMAQATFKAVRIVDTRVTSLPARSDQAQPAKTAETENTGVKA
ncbi:phage baseplate protein, partial [Streptomyces scabiei]|uniref:phage baseplate protein n=1 Tax=Streptomyces scabiei TaxID=1930 RepID=UPI0038F7A002